MELEDHKTAASLLPEGLQLTYRWCHKEAGISQEDGVSNCDYKASHTQEDDIIGTR